MRIIVNGTPRHERREYALGPLRLKVHEDRAEIYNLVVQAYHDAKIAFYQEHGYPWDTSRHLDVKVSHRDLAVFASFGRQLEEACQEYTRQHPEPIKLSDLAGGFLIPVLED